MWRRNIIIFYLRRLSLFRLALVIFLVALLILILTLTVFERSLKPTIRELAVVKARSAATEAVNKAIKEMLTDSVDYQELIYIEKDTSGRIVLMQPNIVRINKLASDTTLAINDSLKDLVDEQFFIPIGQVLGSQLLANYGPRIGVSIYPIGTVQTNVFDRFEEAGINQTRHRLYLDVQSQVKVVVPLITSNTKVTAKVPITETIIVGEVPRVYVNSLRNN